MAKNKSQSYIQYELDWFEQQLIRFREEVENILTNLEDRTETFITTKGIPTIKIIATKEDQLKVAKDILKDLPAMFEALEQMREKRAETKIDVRGGSKMNGMMEEYIDNATSST